MPFYIDFTEYTSSYTPTKTYTDTVAAAVSLLDFMEQKRVKTSA